MTYPATAIEIAIPELDGKTAKMYRGGKICLTDHFKPLWAKNVPKFGIAHAMALGVGRKNQHGIQWFFNILNSAQLKWFLVITHLMHIQFPPHQLWGSHVTQYHCGYCKLQYSWGYYKGLFILHCNCVVLPQCTLMLCYWIVWCRMKVKFMITLNAVMQGWLIAEM